MLFTERKALEEMFSYLEQDKRTIKSQARQDIENIENRQMQLMDRLQRLDDLEREAVDVEGVLHQLAATTEELTQLIPHVPFGDVLERAAQLIAEKPDIAERITVEPEKEIMREKIVEAARVQQVNSPIQKTAAKPLPTGRRKRTSHEDSAKQFIKIMREIGRPASAAEIGRAFEQKFGVAYSSITQKMRQAMDASKGKILRDENKLYYLKEISTHERDREGKEKATV